MIWRRVLLISLISFNFILFYNLIWSDNGIFAYFDLKARHKQLEEKLEAVNNSTLDLSQEIRWLKSDNAYIEKVVRSQLNYFKDNEIVYVFSPAKSQGETQGAGR